MLAFVITACLLLLSLGAPAALADVIHLKNGDVIYADQAKDSGSKVRYEVGDSTFAIPKALVQSVETTTSRVVTPQANFADLPAYTPSTPVSGEEPLLGDVIQGGKVNRDSLTAIESHGNASQTCVAYYIAGKQEFESGQFSEARRDLESALHYDAQNPAVLNYYAALLVRTGSARDATTYAERAVRIAPDSADAFAVLGYAQFASDRMKDAIQSWNKSLALRPDASIERLLERAQRESKAETNYSEHETGHFVLRYEGHQSSEAFRSQIMATLEAAYADLTADFGSQPKSSIQVVLYTDQAFFDVTQAPSWTGALNDGKLRIPLQGLDSVTPELARILRHELAHSFVNQLSMGRCPHWLNEGIAQALEPRSLGSHGARLAALFKLEREIPLNALESSFISFSGAEAILAYDESLASVQYIKETYGMSDVLRVLERLANGESPEAALRGSIHCDYRRLQEEVGIYLQQQFGS